LAGNGGVNGSMLHSMVAAVLVKKPVMVGKGAVGDNVVEPKMVFACTPDLLGRDNLNRTICTI